MKKQAFVRIFQGLTIVLALTVTLNVAQAVVLTDTITPQTCARADASCASFVDTTSTGQIKWGSFIAGGLRSLTNFFVDGRAAIGTLTISTGEQPLKLDVEGAVGARFYCDQNGNHCVAGDQLGGGNSTTTTGGISRLNQGFGIIFTPNPITASGTIAVDKTIIQSRVSGVCTNGAISAINENGTVSCVDVATSTSGTGDGNWVRNGNNIHNTNSGNVGINMGNPAYKLDVAGSVNISGNKAFKLGGINLAFGNKDKNNYFFGNAGNDTMTGEFNTAVGNLALTGGTNGGNNSAFGAGTLVQTTGSQNTAVGAGAGSKISSGSDNTLVGNSAGFQVRTGNQNTFLGSMTGFALNGGSSLQKVDAVNSMALGYGAYTTKDNQVVIGNDQVSQTLLKGTVGIGTNDPSSLVKLHVSGNTGFLAAFVDTRPVQSNNAMIAFRQGSDNSYTSNVGLYSGIMTYIATQKGYAGGFTANPSVHIFQVFDQKNLMGDKINALAIDYKGQVGINTIYPSATLDVKGNVKIADGTQGAGKVLTSDANGLASWKSIGSTGGSEIKMASGICEATATKTFCDYNLAQSGFAANDEIHVMVALSSQGEHNAAASYTVSGTNLRVSLTVGGDSRARNISWIAMGKAR